MSRPESHRDHLNLNASLCAQEQPESGMHSHAHPHTHPHTETKAVVNRLSRAIGHLESVKRMVLEGRDCSEVLIQLAAVKAAVNNAGKIILKDHIEHCIVEAVKRGDQEMVEKLKKAVDSFL